MQAVILAAGSGTRMRPLSAVTPKPMLPVADRPLVAHVADAAVAAGADELVFVVGYKADHVRAYFGERYADTPVSYALQRTPNGTAAAVRAADHLVDGDFAVLNGDSVFDPESVVALFGHDAAVAAHRVADPAEYGVLSTVDGVVTGIEEKPDDPRSTLVNAGAYVFPEAALSALDVPESERGEREITDVLAWLLDRRDVAAVETERWLDVARPADLLRANELVLADRPTRLTGAVSSGATVEGVVQVAESATVADGATLRGPVFVGRDATVAADATLLGPTVVGATAAVGEATELERTLLLPGAAVGDGVRLSDVLLGPRCEILHDAEVAGVTDERDDGASAVVAADVSPENGLRY
jgi:bifunctional UDP-N-acetylglucosamine pyrophosphorylase/glucosamine-1-phosphate N-acetyltransferase